MQIEPFKAILYNTDLVNLADVVTLPYDKISPKKKAYYTAKSPYNIAYAILAPTHKQALSLLRRWQKQDILKRDISPAVYIYEQEYEYPAGGKRIRRGFIAALRLEPFSKNGIMPHEKTFSKIVQDRMQLLSNCKMNLGQIFVLYNDPERTVDNLLSAQTENPPIVKVKDETGVAHRIWKIADPRVISNIQKNMESKRLFIADGHHRYQAALAYKQQQEKMLKESFTGKEGFNYRMAVFINAASPGLTILPTHRVIKHIPKFSLDNLLSELKKYFLIETYSTSAGLLDNWLNSIHNSIRPHIFGMYPGGDNAYTLRLKPDISIEKSLGLSRPREWLYLDVNILHLVILNQIIGIDTQDVANKDNILYISDANKAFNLVKDKKADIAFILNPTKIEEIKNVVELQDVMPQKSTDFYPKLYTGFVMRQLD